MIVRTALVALVALGTIGSAAAEGRPDTRTLTCQQAQSMVQANGAVVMTTGPHTFRRFVRSYAYCTRDESLRREPAPTRTGACIVGYRCVLSPDLLEGIFD